MTIKQTISKYELKPGTKVGYKLVSIETNEITKAKLDSILEWGPMMKRLGGTEHLTRSYTPQGYMPVKLVSKSPDRQQKTVRTFEY